MEASRNDHPPTHVTGARARAQRAKLDLRDEQRHLRREQASPTSRPTGARASHDLLARRRARTTVVSAVEDFLADHEGATIAPKPSSGIAMPCAGYLGRPFEKPACSARWRKL